jgi:hypothetical protein
VSAELAPAPNTLEKKKEKALAKGKESKKREGREKIHSRRRVVVLVVSLHLLRLVLLALLLFFLLVLVLLLPLGVPPTFRTSRIFFALPSPPTVVARINSASSPSPSSAVEARRSFRISLSLFHLAAPNVLSLPL